MLAIFSCQAQHFAIKTNIASDATTSPSLGLEFALSRHISFDVTGSTNPWKFDNKKAQFELGRGELRYWAQECFNGLFLGAHGLYVDYKVDNLNLLNVMKKNYSYNGNAYGGGFSIGYDFYLSPHWSLEFVAGGGYIHFEYDKSNFSDQAALGRFSNDYFGPTHIGISFTYLIK